MVCEGKVDEEGIVCVRGTYSAPPGPDWGWQITIEPESEEVFRFLMHNITPEGKKELAVEVMYSQQT